MDFKLDENFGRAVQQLFLDHGHDCATVRDENLAGAPDDDILLAAQREERVLVTMDHDFTNVLRYPPRQSAGIVVINPPGRASLGILKDLVMSMLLTISADGVRRKLWIVEPGRIREREG